MKTTLETKVLRQAYLGKHGVRDGLPQQKQMDFVIRKATRLEPILQNRCTELALYMMFEATKKFDRSGAVPPSAL